ncbi:tetraacyldisaccharide 4'-kinase [Galbibacter mesophilus]|uniref:tetraacyldisaccharide 4'-kinase n=1 Tax=Galbibacter mesophilus TaxID=379069 RepID=UPI00191FE74B|nr:tetraacyldisaccharide 4'-kinase [Galbibacter mesophilus]MCM5661587.1 tetraacyldisaccharide 4'-kinase [Galbibacter mesophilus]
MGSWRKLLLPFSWIYGAIILVRNYLFDVQVLKSVRYNFPVICIGNLSVGGTGKTPMTEYVAKLLNVSYKTAILSRGYKRSSKGFVLASEDTTVEIIGDEPFQYFQKLKGVTVAVDENRQHGISELQQTLNPDVVILDDAFQHRKVTAGLNILLTMYGDLYVDDLLLPAGNLRDLKSQARRAAIIVVTKCPIDLEEIEKQEIKRKLRLRAGQQVFFSTIAYQKEFLGSQSQLSLAAIKDKNFTVVTGIANPAPFLSYLKGQGLQFEHLKYRDHHKFSAREIDTLKKKELIVTTEKDYVRLAPELNNVVYLPIKTTFLDGKEAFDAAILNFVQNHG